jgi:hypothetical protein
MVQDASGGDVPDARFMVSYLHLEEKLKFRRFGGWVSVVPAT